MLLIYTPKITSRSKYTFKTVFKTFLKYNDYKLTLNLDEFVHHSGPKFSYAPRAIEKELHFSSSGLLEQVGIKEQSVTLGKYKEVPTLFTNGNASALPYDLFAASFFMLSRYEEYLPHRRDEYDRFTAKESIAMQHNFLQIAVVDRWVMQLKELLQVEFKELVFPKREYKYIPTIDIDNAYAYKHKGIVRSLASLSKSVSKLEIDQLRTKISVLSGKKRDPFDTYNYQLNIQKKYKINPIYFILIGDYGLNDKNLSYENQHFRLLIKSLSDYASLGIHPSYGSNKEPKRLAVEINRLQDITKNEIKRSRQHFLKLSLPETYRNLLEVDIEEDYTMGFAGQLGFRAGTCTPYPFYDLDGEVECKLVVYPFQVMEATLKYYLKLGTDASIVEIKKIIEEVRAVNGTFVSLWHNESLSDEMEWKGWRKVYEEMITYATQKG